MTPRKELSVLYEYIVDTYYYEDGFLYLKKPLRNGRKGKIKGYINSNGYRVMSLKNIGYYYHRVIYCYFNKNVPDMLDHINLDKNDNRIENLRHSDSSKNTMNKNKYAGAGLYKGVSFHKKHKRFIAHIGFNNKLIHIGYYNTEKEAAIAYNKKAKELYGDHARFNIIK